MTGTFQERLVIPTEIRFALATRMQWRDLRWAGSKTNRRFLDSHPAVARSK